MKMSSIFFALTILLNLSPAFGAQGSSIHDPIEIQKGVRLFVDLYRQPEPTEMSRSDQIEIADALAELLAMRSAATFNEMIANLMDEYQEEPSHREALELFFQKVSEKTAEEIERETLADNPTLNVLDGVFMAFWVSYSLGNVGSFEANLGKGLKAGAYIQKSLREAYQNMPGGKNAGWAIVGIGTTAGLLKANYEHYRTKKVNTKQLLAETQGRIFLKHAIRLVEIRDQLQKSRIDIGNLDSEVTTLRDQIEHLSEVAPQFTHLRATTALDLNAIKVLISQ